MENQFTYIVETYNTKTTKGISADETVTFSRANPLEARAEAINFAYDSLQEYISEIDLSQFPTVEHIHFNSWYIGNYPKLDKKKINNLIEILNRI